MQNKADDFATEIKVKGPRTKNDYWIDLVHTIRKTMDYPLVATQLKEREWDDIMSILHKAALPRCGIVQMFPHAVLYGPKKFQGSGQEHPYFKQEILHIYELVKEINMNSQQGIQYRVTVEQLKIEQGFPGNWTEAILYSLQVQPTASSKPYGSSATLGAFQSKTTLGAYR
jgi:hypothetical protein